jgi:hypothetical protein
MFIFDDPNKIIYMPKSIMFNGCSVGENPLSCFDDVSEKELDFIENNSLEVEYKKGEIICKQGSFASQVMILKSGLARI